MPTEVIQPSATPLPPSATPLPTSLPTATPPPRGQVGAGRDGLRLRAFPSEQGEILLNLDELTPLTILGRTSDNIWLSVTTDDGDSGWVMTEFVDMNTELNTLTVIDPLETVTQPQAAANFSGDGIVVAEGDGLRLRELPSTNSAILDNLPEQSPVNIIGRSEDATWIQVTTPDGKTGWVYAVYIQHNIDLNAVAISPEAAIPTPANFEPPTTSSAANGAITGITSTSAQIFLRGQSLGNRANVFSKVGDSITATGHFMYSFGWGRYDLHEYAYYQPVIDFFSSATARESNSFSNGSMAAKSGWKTSTVLDPASADTGTCRPGEMPLVCEYRVVRPSVSLIMIGTNDLPELSAEQFQANLNQIVQITIDMGVIPVLSTIPTRQYWEAKADQFNQVIIATARAFDIPLWDYASAMRTLPNQGLNADGLHPSWVGSDYNNFDPSGDFTAENLQYGFPLRNLMGLQVLDAIWRQVIAPNMQYAGPVTGQNTDGLQSNYNAPAASQANTGSTNTNATTPTSCPGAPPFRLRIGQSARVTPGPANNLRASATSGSQVIGQISAGEVFTILAGPVCSDSMTYWQVNYNGQVGWTAEGRGDTYWLEPIN